MTPVAPSIRIRRLDASDLDAIADLCRRSLADAPSRDELEGALFVDDQPVAVFGEAGSAVVAVAECEEGLHIRLLVVDPARRGQRFGHALLDAAEDWVRSSGHASLQVGADPPYFLWPGAPSTEIELLCLLERRHYVRVEANFNMDVDLHAILPDPGGHVLAQPHDHAEVDDWMACHWPNWRLEVLRALDRGNLVLARDDGSGDLTAFCAFEVNRSGLLGPIAVRPDLMGRGCGRGVLLGALHELRRRGRDRVSVVWVGPVVPYGAVGGRVSQVYFVYRKELA